MWSSGRFNTPFLPSSGSVCLLPCFNNTCLPLIRQVSLHSQVASIDFGLEINLRTCCKPLSTLRTPLNDNSSLNFLKSCWEVYVRAYLLPFYPHLKNQCAEFIDNTARLKLLNLFFKTTASGNNYYSLLLFFLFSGDSAISNRRLNV